MTVTVRSFAKINLGLRIGAARADGFHELLTIYQTIGLHDLLTVGVERGTGIEIRCDDPRVPRDETNTCWRMVEKAMRALKAKGRVVIAIEKRLPVQGGMGGASSNAVAALLGIERAFKKFLPADERLRIAAEVGSDLPLFLIGGTVLGVGRGELVYPLEDLGRVDCVVVTPEVGVSTPKAFAAWDSLCGADTPFDKFGAGFAREGASQENRVVSATGKPAGLRPAWTDEGVRPHTSTSIHTGQPGAAVTPLTSQKSSDRMVELGREYAAWLSDGYTGAPRSAKLGTTKRTRGRLENPLLELVRTGIKNDFESVVFPEYPELSEGKKALERAGAKYASLSGSGSALYGLFASNEAALAAVAKLRRQGWAAQATAMLTRKEYWAKFLVSSS